MKIIKKLFSYVITVILITGSINFTASAETSTFAFTSTYKNEMFLLQYNACAAHEKLYNSFEWEETYKYPEDFAGDYIDIDILHILVTDSSAIGYYKDLLYDYDDNIVYDIVDYSYVELNSALEYCVSYLKQDFDIIAYGIDVIQNKGFIQLLASDYENIISSPSTYNLTNNIFNDDLIIIESRDDYVEREVSVIAGTPIKYGSYMATLAGSGAYNGSTAFITAGHCSFSVGDSVTVGSSSIGTVTIKQCSASDYGDYSIITAATGYTATSTVFTTGGATTRFGGYLNNPAVGTYLYKYGQTSGEAYCKVTRTGVSTNLAKGMTEAELISGDSAAGDSGGSYRNGDYFCGIHSGSNTNNGTTYVYFTPNVYLYNSGFIIATN